MKSIIDDNRYQSISINQLILIIDDQSMKSICGTLHRLVILKFVYLCGLLDTLKTSRHPRSLQFARTRRIFVS